MQPGSAQVPTQLWSSDNTFSVLFDWVKTLKLGHFQVKQLTKIVFNVKKMTGLTGSKAGDKIQDFTGQIWTDLRCCSVNPEIITTWTTRPRLAAFKSNTGSSWFILEQKSSYKFFINIIVDNISIIVWKILISGHWFYWSLTFFIIHWKLKDNQICFN